MPRNSTSTVRKSNVPVVSPLAPPMPTKNSPSLGGTLVESMTSGLGSGVGFGLGSSLVRSIFGSGAGSSAGSSAASSASVNNDYEQCLEANRLNGTEASCYHLSNQYKACMIRTNYNANTCKEIYN